MREDVMQIADRTDAADLQSAAVPALRARGLTAWYGGPSPAIKDVDLDILPHKATAIIGPSGCGKSTALRCLNRMHEVIRGARVEGHVYLEGEDVYAPGVDAVRVRRRIG